MNTLEQLSASAGMARARLPALGSTLGVAPERSDHYDWALRTRRGQKATSCTAMQVLSVRSPVTLLLGGLFAASLSAFGQDNPIALPYRIGQGSVGDSGAVSPIGGYATSVPLELPGPRGDLPLPLSVVYTGATRLGAAGVGWSVPLLYVRQSTLLSGRKPAHLGIDDTALPKPPIRLFLDLGAGPILMVENDDTHRYRPMAAPSFLELFEIDSGWAALDSAGRRYEFAHVVNPDPDPSIPSIGTELGDDTLWMLTRIVDRTLSNWVSLSYDIFDMIPPPPHEVGGDFTIKEIVLRSLAYSPDRSGSCPKHRIDLSYRHVGSTSPFPRFLDLYVDEGRLRARTRILRDIRIWSQTDVACDKSTERLLRTYQFEYGEDADTGLPQLISVDTFGRDNDGTDLSTALPVRRYEYASATEGVDLTYGPPRAIELQSSPPALYKGHSSVFINGDFYLGLQFLLDITGDRRADYMQFVEPDQFQLRANVAATDGSGMSTFPDVQTYVHPFDLYTTGSPGQSFSLASLAPTFTTTWRQFIDWNGDGRLDIVDALQGKDPDGDFSPDYWLVLVNTPGLSGNPGSIEWKESYVDISFIREEIRQSHSLDTGNPAFLKKPLPLMRSHGTYVYNASDDISEESGRVTEWKLADLNGDAFPDFVFNDKATFGGTREHCESSNDCHTDLTFDVPFNNSVKAFYHTGPLMAGAGEPGIARWAGPSLVVRVDGQCGVERFVWANRTQHMACGFIEVNGDELLDYAVEQTRTINGQQVFERFAIRSSGLPQEIDETLPENTTAWNFQEKGRAILLPGPINVVESGRAELCGRDPDSGSTPYSTRQISSLRDLTADGVPDYLYRGTPIRVANGAPLDYPGVESAAAGPEGWWIMIGTATGYKPPRRIRTDPTMQFEIHTTQERCDGFVSHTIDDLMDIDGDGRLDLIGSQQGNQIRLSRLIDIKGQIGAHAAGRLIAESNGHGAETRITYASAKDDWKTKQWVPFPQIVVSSVQPIAKNGLGTSLAPTRYAYGDARLHYHPLLARWTFRGYGRRVILEGLPLEEGHRVLGTATIFDSLHTDDLATAMEQQSLSGAVHQINDLVGAFNADPRDLLDVDVELNHRRRRNRSIKYGIEGDESISGNPVLVSLNEECYDVHPWQLGTGDPELCRRPAIVYHKELSDWEGFLPYPSPKSVATRSYVPTEGVDEFGRLTRLVLQNDRSRFDDDVCVHISYAKPRRGAVRVLDAIHELRLQDCIKDSVVYDGARYVYDDLPEGQVKNGLISKRITEIYDPWAGEKLEEYPSEQREHDLLGNVTRITMDRGDGVVQSQLIRFDPFGLVPEKVETSANDVEVTVVDQIRYDPVSLLPSLVIDENGLELRAYYDGFDRLTMSTAKLPADDIEHIQVTKEYLGHEGLTTEGRRVRERIFREWTPLTSTFEAPAESSSAVSISTSFFDEFGRPRFTQINLGANFPNDIVDGFAQYDLLGRPQFTAFPFDSGQPISSVYGTTFHYAADSSLHCLIQGTGPQDNIAVTDEAEDRYTRCFSRDFSDHVAIVQTYGPNELLAGSPQFGAYTERTVSATGRVLSVARWQSGERLELAQFGYDKLSQLRSITRYAAANAMDGPVTWLLASDSLGQARVVQEPAAAERRYDYDRWGNQVRTTWTDATNTPSIERAIVSRYDGLSRLITVDETVDGTPLLERRSEYFYDTQAESADHLQSTHLLGRLSHARDAVMTSYFGYDGMGRKSADTRVHHGDGARQSTFSRLGPLGELEELSFADSDGATDVVNYTYDSAGNLDEVRLTTAASTIPLWAATEIDLFGRYRSMKYGNGVTAHFEYRPDRRREMRGVSIVRPGAQEWRLDYHGFDGQMKVKGLTEKAADASKVTSYQYDSLNRLRRVQVSSDLSPISDETFSYDGLGNLVEIQDLIGPDDLVFVPDIVDHDRLCRTFKPQPGMPEGPGSDLLLGTVGDLLTSVNRSQVAEPYDFEQADVSRSSLCQMQYDAVGNVTRIAGESLERSFEYDARSRSVGIQEGDAVASSQYDAFGALGERTVTGVGLGIDRTDRYYGALVESTTFLDDFGAPTPVNGPGSTQSYFDRIVPGPIGLIVHLRRTDVGKTLTLYPHGDLTSTRLITDELGELVQGHSYRPFGEAVVTVTNAQHDNSIKYLWNGGENLVGFGLTQLGPRLYAPSLGRFLQRDPVLVARSATRTHPYAFAWNDPVNFGDPSGMDSTCLGAECDYLQFGPWGDPGITLGAGGWGEGWVQISAPEENTSWDWRTSEYSEWYDLAQRYPCLACHSTRAINRLPMNHEWDEGDLLADWSANATVGGRIILGSTGVGAIADLALGYFVFDEDLDLMSVASVTPIRGFRYARSGLKYRSRVGVGGRLESVMAKIEPQHIGNGSATNSASRRLAQQLGRATDHAGHAGGRILGFPGGARSGNIFAQFPKANVGPFAQYETWIADQVMAGAKVYVRVVPQYAGSSTRPFRVLYQARINGKTYSRIFDNMGLWVPKKCPGCGL